MKMNKVLLIVPTRGRPDSSIEFYEEFKKNSTITDLVFGLDDDDVEYPRIDGVLYEVNPRAMMNGTLNLIANKYADQYEYIAFLGDDHRTRTYGWDAELVNSIKDIKHGIAYGNDLLQGRNLPTAVLLKSSIVKTLGLMAPPAMKHLYLDNFWKDMGVELHSLFYRDDVIIEHLHPVAGKADNDSGYVEVNSSAIYDHDRNAYANYWATERASDLEKLLND
jgi:hypothetical protein